MHDDLNEGVNGEYPGELIPGIGDPDLPLVPAELLEPEGMDEDRWQQLLDWADAQAETDVDLVLDDIPETARWQCRTEADAVWAMGRLAHHIGEIDAVAVLAEQYRQRIDRWEAQRTKRHGVGAAVLEAQLELWAVRRREATDVKSFTFPNGKITTKLVGETVKVEDRDALVQWAKANGLEHKLKVRESMDVSDLKSVGEFVERVDATMVRLQCGDETTVEGTSAVGEVVGCRMHPGDLVMVSEVLGQHVTRVFVDKGRDPHDPVEQVPGTRYEPARIGVTIKPDVVTPDEYA